MVEKFTYSKHCILALLFFFFFRMKGTAQEVGILAELVMLLKKG